MTLPVVIQSLPRSGNHLLMALLYENFVFEGDLSVTTTAGAFPNPVYTYGGKRQVLNKKHPKAKVPYGKLFGNHGVLERAQTEPSRILYLMRHPVRRAISEWRFHHPEGGVPWSKYINRDTMTMWLNHVLSYLGAVQIVQYEGFALAPFAMLETVEAAFGLHRKHEQWENVLENVGWQPAKRPVQTKDVTPEMLLVAGQVIPEGFCGYSFTTQG